MPKGMKEFYHNMKIFSIIDELISEWEVNKVTETIERKPFKSIHIDTEKGIYLLNGEEVSMVSRIDLEFNNGKWSLLITRDELYAQEVEKN